MATISIITPTISRPSLARTLASLVPGGISANDEVLVIGDGKQPVARRMFDHALLPCRAVYFETEATGDVGGSQRNQAQRRARGEYLMYLDDDDILADGALTLIRDAIAQEPGIPLLFRHLTWWGQVLPADESLGYGNISGTMLVQPNTPDMVPDWGPEYGHDHGLIHEVIKRYDGRFSWRPELIVICRPPAE